MWFRYLDFGYIIKWYIICLECNFGNRIQITCTIISLQHRTAALIQMYTYNHYNNTIPSSGHWTESNWIHNAINLVLQHMHCSSNILWCCDTNLARCSKSSTLHVHSNTMFQYHFTGESVVCSMFIIIHYKSKRSWIVAFIVRFEQLIHSMFRLCSITSLREKWMREIQSSAELPAIHVSMGDAWHNVFLFR